MSRVDRATLDEVRRLAREPTLAWRPFYPGVEIYRLWGEPPAESAALLRYAPGAAIPRHRHEGHEYIYMLDGAQRDEDGLHAAGSRRVNQPGSIHTVESPDGCLVLVIWERPNTFLDSTRGEGWGPPPSPSEPPAMGSVERSTTEPDAKS